MRNFNIRGKIWFLRVIIFRGEQSYSYLFEKYVIAVFRYDPVHQAVTNYIFLPSATSGFLNYYFPWWITKFSPYCGTWEILCIQEEELDFFPWIAGEAETTRIMRPGLQLVF